MGHPDLLAEIFLGEASCLAELGQAWAEAGKGRLHLQGFGPPRPSGTRTAEYSASSTMAKGGWTAPSTRAGVSGANQRGSVWISVICGSGRPIGLAGGLNLYGFAGGDPVNVSDPFGLCPPWPDCIAQAMANWGARRGGVLGDLALNVGAGLNAGFEATGINGAAAAGEAIGSGNFGAGWWRRDSSSCLWASWRVVVVSLSASSRARPLCRALLFMLRPCCYPVPAHRRTLESEGEGVEEVLGGSFSSAPKSATAANWRRRS